MFWEVGLDAQPLYLLCIILSLAAEVDTGRNQGAAAEADVYGRAAAELNAIREQQAEMSTIESSWVWPHEIKAVSEYGILQTHANVVKEVRLASEA